MSLFFYSCGLTRKNMTAYCDLWNGTFTGMFHAANSVIGIGFAVPQSFDYGLLTLKFFVCLGLFMLLFWASELICFAPWIRQVWYVALLQTFSFGTVVFSLLISAMFWYCSRNIFQLFCQNTWKITMNLCSNLS